MENYPMCLSYGDHQLWVGDRIGQVQLIDTSEDKFELVQVRLINLLFFFIHIYLVNNFQSSLGSTCSQAIYG